MGRSNDDAASECGGLLEICDAFNVYPGKDILFRKSWQREQFKIVADAVAEDSPHDELHTKPRCKRWLG
jgi:hypothetical protein